MISGDWSSDVCSSDLYLVMELVDGQSLLEFITSRKEKRLFLK